MMQASGFDGLVFDPFTFEEDGLPTPEVDISRRKIGDAFVISQMIVVADEVSGLLSDITGQIKPLQGHYDNPENVLRDVNLTIDEKRELLASWASDARAVPDHPDLRRLDDGKNRRS